MRKHGLQKQRIAAALFSVLATLKNVLLLTLLLPLPAVLADDKASLKRPDGSSIRYYLKQSPGYLKENSSKTLLVLMQGSNCNSVIHNPTINQFFSQVMPGANILTVEKYGISPSVSWNPSGDSRDCPASYVSYDSPQQRLNDYLQVINTVKSEQHYHRIVLLGGSEGATVAAMVAAENSEVDAVISLNGGGRFFIDDIFYSMSQELPPQAFEEARQGFTGFTDNVKSTDQMDINMSGHGFRWWKNMLSIDQTENYLKIKAPLLIIQSEADTSVSPTLTAQQAETIRLNKDNATYLSFPGIDHGFKDAQGNNHEAKVVAAIQKWIANTIH